MLVRNYPVIDSDLDRSMYPKSMVACLILKGALKRSWPAHHRGYDHLIVTRKTYLQFNLVKYQNEFNKTKIENDESLYSHTKGQFPSVTMTRFSWRQIEGVDPKFDNDYIRTVAR